MNDIVYALEPDLSVDDYIKVVGDSSLGATRPIGDRDRVGAMLRGASLIVSARLEGECVGLARGLTDFAWVCYLGDLAVRNAFQGRGIGTGLLLKCKEVLGGGIGVALLSVPEAVAYYDRLAPTLGLQRYEHAYWMSRTRGI